MKKRGRHAIVADTVFDGRALHHDAAVIIEGAAIVGLMAGRDLPASVARRDLPEGAWLAPGFIDVQVNGGGDVLFNDTPTPAGIAAIVAAHRHFGTTGLMPTLISDSAAKMKAGSRFQMPRSTIALLAGESVRYSTLTGSPTRYRGGLAPTPSSN